MRRVEGLEQEGEVHSEEDGEGDGERHHGRQAPGQGAAVPTPARPPSNK